MVPQALQNSTGIARGKPDEKPRKAVCELEE